MEKLESDLENFVRLCHLHEKVHNLEQALAEKDLALAQANRHKDELFQKLAEKDREIAHLKESVAHYDRWLSIGVYYTNEEFFERVLKPKQQLMEKAVRWASYITTIHGKTWEAYKDAEMFLDSPEFQAWKEQQS